MAIVFHIASTAADFLEGKLLFEEYAASLNVDLCFQGFSEELETLHVQYNLPHGCLILVKEKDVPVGCAAIRKYDDKNAELKRMYLKPECRGKKLGQKLLQLMLDKAIELGYAKMRLDTLPQMKEAQRLYRKFGFKDIDSYRFNPVEGTVYLEKDLS